jgi:flagellar basal-body rod protein FlgC
MNIIGELQSTYDALTVQQRRMQVIAENIAQSQTTRTPSGGAYQRKMVNFSSYLDQNSTSGFSGASLPRLKMDGITYDETPGMRVEEPGHPHADEDGFVTYPNVSVSMEMVDLLEASRAYEANLASIRTAKEMAEQAMSMGR